ncbi:MAG: hypothetical protein M3680_16745, partial [Myxococcota bacterium]|nr:hypothetical protein [Myxococcota bacterium]
MRAVALVVALSVSLAACFPNSARHRTYAKLGEGGALAAGITMLYFVNTGADCDMNPTPGLPAEDCKNDASILSTVGLGLILLGLVGFVATVSTSPDDDTTATPATTPPAAPPAPSAEPMPAAA